MAQSRIGSSEIPDLTEIWAKAGCTPNGVDCPFVTAEVPLRAAALAFQEMFDEAWAPKYDCVPSTSPALVTDPYNFQIEQLEDRAIFTYEKDDVVRTIWLNGHGHPEPSVYERPWQGHSIGWYEGNQLVVETTHFPFDPTGFEDRDNLPSSTQKRTIERYWREGDELNVELTVEDPLFLFEPFTFLWQWVRTDTPLLLPYGCDPEIARSPLKYLPPKYPD